MSFVTSPCALRLLNSALRRWGWFPLGWPPGSPVASVFSELGWPDAEHLSTGRLLSLSLQPGAMPANDRRPFLPPSSVSHHETGDLGCHSNARICGSLGIALLKSFGVGSGSSSGSVHSWCRSCVSPRLDQSLRDRLFTATCGLAVSHVDLRLLTINHGPDHVVHRRSTLPSHVRFWELARWRRGCAACHLGSSSSCVVCDAPQGDLAHCRSFSLCVHQSRTSVTSGAVGCPFSSRSVFLSSSSLDLNPSSSHNTSPSSDKCAKGLLRCGECGMNLSFI